jgi:hypothetical protein
LNFSPVGILVFELAALISGNQVELFGPGSLFANVVRIVGRQALKELLIRAAGSAVERAPASATAFVSLSLLAFARLPD